MIKPVNNPNERRKTVKQRQDPQVEEPERNETQLHSNQALTVNGLMCLLKDRLQLSLRANTNP